MQTRTMPEIRPMRPDEIGLALDWAAAEGWNPGLWEPPSLVRESSGASPEDLQAAWQGSGAPGQLGEELGVVRHTITRHKIQARVHLLETPADTAYQDPSQVGLTGLARKILRRWV